MSYSTHVLDNGLRIIHEWAPLQAVYCGYVVCAGTRDEEPQDAGMAHFIEHLTFKGTSHRRAWQIAGSLERRGGDLNAFTNLQETVFQAWCLKTDFRRAAEVLTDMVFCSNFPQQEISKEVEVICDEIDSFRDSPAELIFDDFESSLFPGHGLGRDVLGNKKRLRQYAAADALRFTQKHYRPENAVFYVLGDVDFSRIVATLENLSKIYLPDAEKRGFIVKRAYPPLPPYEPQRRTVRKKTHQAYVVLGNRSYSGNDPRRFSLALLSNLLGGPAMNSRLNTALRERHGLVYAVESSVNVYTNAGSWLVYFGCDPKDVERCLDLTQRELLRLINEPLSERQLTAAKKQYVGQLRIAADNLENRPLVFSRCWANYYELYDIEADCEHVMALTAEDLQGAAAEVFSPQRLSTLIYR